MKPLTFGSLFAGIGGFDLAFERAGMRCAWQVDNDANCNRVLGHWWPDVERFGDVRECGKHNLAPVDLICGGFPCQDLSVAGRREGLDGERSGLWYEFARIIGELEPRWAVVENVTGLLSSGERRDMGILLGQLAQFGYMGAWRVLDAQFDGVAQRRRRVFIVGHLGDGRAAEVLFERTGSAWHPAPSREAGARVAAPLTKGSATGRGVNEPGRRREDDVNLVAFQCHGSNVGPMGTIRSGNAGLTGGVPFVARPLAFGQTIDHYDESQQTYIVQSVALRGREGGATAELGGETMTALRASQGEGDKPHVMIYKRRGGFGWSEAEEMSPTLESQGNLPILATPWDTQAKRVVDIRGISPTLQCAQGRGVKRNMPTIMHQFGVRRLTPLECERLQGFPDDFTAWGIDEDGEQVELSDSARYRMLGNAVAVPVAEWIGRRIVEVEATHTED